MRREALICGLPSGPLLLAHAVCGGGGVGRWTGQQLPGEEIPLDLTLALMDEVGAERGMICAWHDASGPLIGNDEEGLRVSAHPGRVAGVASARIRRGKPSPSPI